jgi:hypothetical protein
MDRRRFLGPGMGVIGTASVASWCLIAARRGNPHQL